MAAEINEWNLGLFLPFQCDFCPPITPGINSEVYTLLDQILLNFGSDQPDHMLMWN